MSLQKNIESLFGSIFSERSLKGVENIFFINLNRIRSSFSHNSIKQL